MAAIRNYDHRRSLFLRGRASRHALRSALIEKLWVRYLTLAVIVTVGAVAIMTPDERAMVATKAAFLIGHSSPALVLGAVIGWTTFSRKWWLWSTAVLGVLTLGFAFQACWPNS